jgi:hypothetical protein
MHQWLASAVHRTYAYLNASEQERVLRWAVRDCGRDPRPNEIERTVENIRRKRGNGEAAGQYYKPWPPPVPEAVDETVLHEPSNLRSESPWRFPKGSSISRKTTVTEFWGDADGAPGLWLSRLFLPDSNLCLGQERLYCALPGAEPSIYRKWRTRRRDAWVKEQDGQCRGYDLIVPNPARFTWHFAAAGHRSTRCEAMFPQRRYLIVEFDFSEFSRDGVKETIWASWIRKWKREGLLIKDICGALLLHLSQYAPLVLAVWSGNKSTQGWFNAQAQNEGQLRRFMEYAVALGADSAAWKKCQLFRLPQGTRALNGNRQTVEYFNPNNLPESSESERAL